MADRNAVKRSISTAASAAVLATATAPLLYFDIEFHTFTMSAVGVSIAFMVFFHRNRHARRSIPGIWRDTRRVTAGEAILSAVGSSGNGGYGGITGTGQQ